MPKYSEHWSVDSGREGLWRNPQWKRVLEIVGSHAGQSVYGPKAPIYTVLETEFPGDGWWTDQQRNLFRDYRESWSNTETIDITSGRFDLTPLGWEVVRGNLSREQVLVMMMKTFKFQSGPTVPFQVLASAFVEAAPQPLKLYDVVYGVMGNYRPGIDNLSEALADANQPPAVSRNLTDERRMKLMLALMVSVGALQKKGSDWEPKNVRLLIDIAGAENLTRIIAKRFEADLHDANLRFDNSFIRRFVASVFSKRFAILTGLSGSGKTKLADAFATWLGCDSGKALALVAVGPDWNSRDYVLGYPDALNSGQYETTEPLNLILRALQSDLPHWLILDEMNLSHVERYFSDFLSAIESEREVILHQGLGLKAPGLKGLVPELIPKLPSNFFVVGTVNVDETTYMFSPKVLDRAHVLEFRVDRQTLSDFLQSPSRPDLKAIHGRAGELARAVAVISESEPNLPAADSALLQGELMLFFDILHQFDGEFAFRSAREMVRFAGFHYWTTYPANQRLADTLDAIVMQKILPKLHGGRSELEPVLWALAAACYADRDAAQVTSPNDPLAAVKRAADDAAALKVNFDPAEFPQTSGDVLKGPEPYLPLAFDKLKRMNRRLQMHGFTSFAES